MKRKIAILIVNFKKGGAQRFITHLLTSLSKDYEVHLLLLEGGSEYRIENETIVTVLKPSYPSNEVIKLTLIPIYSYQVYKYLKKHKIQTCISFLNYTNFVNCCVKKIDKNVNTIVSERNFPSKTFEKGIKRVIGGIMLRNLYSAANLIIPNSFGTYLDLSKNFKVKNHYKVIHNFIDFDLVNKLSNVSNYKLKNGVFTFIHVGRFVSEKNHVLLVKAFSKLNFNCNLTLVGSGELFNKIKLLVEELDITNRVSFIGVTDNPFQYLYSADCFVLSSDTEGLPNVVLEALACNLPVISTDCPAGPREILAPNTQVLDLLHNSIEIAEYGILVPTNREDLLIEAMTLMYNDESMRHEYKVKRINRAKDFDKKIVLQEIENVLNLYV